ncbi:MAG TPA: hypothetical protein VMD98_07620 [Bryocella sp.]|nr:hypothetical protein [Bryocella sp.]
MSTAKIGQVELDAAQNLEIPLKSVLKQLGYSVSQQDQLHIELHARNRKIRSDASAEHWSPDEGWIKLYFAPAAGETETQRSDIASAASSSAESTGNSTAPSQAVHMHPVEAEILRALARAEATPGWSFVPLKKFRDEILPSEQPTAMHPDAVHQQMLRSAIEKRFILVGKVPNPKSPQFPVTTIRLNRLRPEVREALGGGHVEDVDFRPVEIRGEPLSSTVLRERR